MDLLDVLTQGRCTMQDDNSWTPNGTAIAILGRFFKSGELVREFWSKELRVWVRAAPADLIMNVTEQAKDLLIHGCFATCQKHVHPLLQSGHGAACA